nr:hypothetical protein [Escherichia coli]
MNIDFFSDVKNPSFPNPNNNAVDLICDIVGVGSGVAFTASRDDEEAHGRQLYENAMNGDYGEISPYIEPDEITTEAHLLTSKQKSLAEITVDAFALQCAVDAGAASPEQAETLNELKQHIANTIGDNR